jgi:oxygen-independent coproporphyrinogen-3 oxidase
MVFTQRVPKELAGEVAPLNGALSESALASLPVADFGLYLHVPFCNVRCGYCDFNTYTSTELRGFRREDWANSFGLELDLAKRVIGDLPDIQTIFIGGGTPTLLPPGDFEKVFDNIESAFTSDIEITIEANPDTVTKESLSGYFKAGINRISFGMQSAVPSVLKVLDRTHDPKAVSQAVELAAEVGFKDISLDLIYGTPTETDNDWTESLLQALSLPINHFSAYSLIVEPGTKLHQQVNE